MSHVTRQIFSSSSDKEVKVIGGGSVINSTKGLKGGYFYILKNGIRGEIFTKGRSVTTGLHFLNMFLHFK